MTGFFNDLEKRMGRTGEKPLHTPSHNTFRNPVGSSALIYYYYYIIRVNTYIRTYCIIYTYTYNYYIVVDQRNFYVYIYYCANTPDKQRDIRVHNSVLSTDITMTVYILSPLHDDGEIAKQHNIRARVVADAEV